MGKFINPFTDFGFKHIFGREMDKEILIEFLNDLLEGEHTIKDLRIMNNERLAETEQGRKVIFDIHCETDKGERIIIEMQNREQPNFKDRALYYLSHSVVEQGIKGTWDFYVLKHMDTLDRMPFKTRKAIFERLERIGSMANLTPKQRAQYEAEWKMYNDYYNTLDFAVKKGIEKGIKKGIEQGTAKGKKEEKCSIALNLKKMGLSMEQIATATGLSREEIRALK